MPDPTAREALISLAEILDFKASTEQHGEHAVAVWRQAAEIARSRAQESHVAANGPADVSSGGEEADGDLSASERDAVMADLGKLLEALGLGNYARPQSPHEVMLELGIVGDCGCTLQMVRLDRLVDLIEGKP